MKNERISKVQEGMRALANRKPDLKYSITEYFHDISKLEALNTKLMGCLESSSASEERIEEIITQMERILFK